MRPQPSSKTSPGRTSQTMVPGPDNVIASSYLLPKQILVQSGSQLRKVQLFSVGCKGTYPTCLNCRYAHVPSASIAKESNNFLQQVEPESDRVVNWPVRRVRQAQ